MRHAKEVDTASDHLAHDRQRAAASAPVIRGDRIVADLVTDERHQAIFQSGDEDLADLPRYDGVSVVVDDLHRHMLHVDVIAPGRALPCDETFGRAVVVANLYSKYLSRTLANGVLEDLAAGEDAS